MGDLVTEPLVQAGFLGLSAVLLAILVWLVQKLVCALRESSRVIQGNTEVLRELLKLNRCVHDKLLSRPCIATREAVAAAVAPTPPAGKAVAP